jgi:WD40 repeat protein
VWLWRVSRRAALPDGALTGATDWVNAVAFSPDGTSLAAGSSDADVRVWDLATRALTATLPHDQPVTSLAWDGTTRLAAGDADGTVSLWSLPTPVLLADGSVNAIAYNSSGSLLAVGSDNLELWNPGRRTLITAVPVPGGSFVNAVAFSAGGILAAGYGDGMAQLWTADGTALTPPLRVTASGMVESVAFSPSGSLLAVGSDDGTVRLWSVRDPARPVLLAVEHDSGTIVFCVAFSPSGQLLAAASADNLTRLWSVRDPSRPARLGPPLAGPASYAISVAFSPSGSLLAVGSADRTVRLWSVRDPVHPVLAAPPLTGPTSYVYDVAFSPSGRTLAAAVTDGTVWLWSLSPSGQPSPLATLTGPNGHAYSVAFAPSGATVAAGSEDGTVRLWDTDPATAAAAVCADAGQPLTREEWTTYVPGIPYRADLLCSM